MSEKISGLTKSGLSGLKRVNSKLSNKVISFSHDVENRLRSDSLADDEKMATIMSIKLSWQKLFLTETTPQQ